MNFSEKFNNMESNDFLVGDIVGIFYKAYMMYLNNQIEDLDIDAEDIPLILELNSIDKDHLNNNPDKNHVENNKDHLNYRVDDDGSSNKNHVENNKDHLNYCVDDDGSSNENNVENNKDSASKKNDSDNIENLSQDELFNHLFSSKFDAVKTFRKLKFLGIIGIKSSADDDKKFEVFLTDHGKEIALKIENMDQQWQKLIYNNLESSDKKLVINNLKDLAISSIKTNKNENIIKNEKSYTDKNYFKNKKAFNHKFFEKGPWSHGKMPNIFKDRMNYIFGFGSPGTPFTDRCTKLSDEHEFDRDFHNSRDYNFHHPMNFDERFNDSRDCWADHRVNDKCFNSNAKSHRKFFNIMRKKFNSGQYAQGFRDGSGMYQMMKSLFNDNW